MGRKGVRGWETWASVGQIWPPRGAQAGEVFAAGNTYFLGFPGLHRPSVSLGQAGGSSGLADLVAAPEPWGICQISERWMKRSLS